MNRFLKEIYEQPTALYNSLQFYSEEKGLAAIREIIKIWNQGNYSQILFTGMGSSYFAGYLASSMLSKYHIPSYVINAGELLHYHLSFLKKETLLICISQSGESYEVAKILDNLSEEMTCIGITNEDNSTLAEKSRLTLLCKAGSEEMTSTKTYVSTLLVLSILANVLANQWGQQARSEIISSVKAVESLINNNQEWLPAAMGFLGQPSFIPVIGRGPVYSSVLQSALMFMEGAGTPAAGFFGGEFRHGPMEMVKEGFSAIVFAPSGHTYNQACDLIKDISKFGGKVVFISNAKDFTSDPRVFRIHIPCDNEYLFPIPAIVPLQFMMNQWAHDQGKEPGNFTRGSKVTLIE